MMHVISLIITSLLVTAVSATISTIHHPVIYGGHETPVDKYKFVASMRPNSRHTHHCGGSLIAPHFILTAAHCQLAKYIVIGSHYNNPNVSVSNVRTVKRVKIHPKYDGEEFKNDFAIVELTEPVLDIKPVLLSLRLEEKYGKMATSMGWGLINPNETSKVLKEQDFKLISPEDCIRRVRKYVPDSVMCAMATSDGNSTCYGDSGGPLVRSKDAARPLLIGVTSFITGGKCANNDAPLGFARVSSAREFIDECAEGHEWYDDTPPSGPSSNTISVSFHPFLKLSVFFLIILEQIW